MKKPKPEPLPIQELLQTQELAVWPLQDFASELSAVPHRHNAYQLIYVQETRGGDNLIDFRRYEMVAGRVFLLGPGQAHQRVARQEQGKIVAFRESLLQTTGLTAHEVLVLFGAAYQHPYLDLPPHLQKTFEQLVQLMEQELEMPVPDYTILSRLLYTLLRYLLREAHLQIAQLTPGRYSERIFQLSTLVEQHFKEHLPVSYYAERIGITPKHLNNICRQSLGVTVADMLHNRLLIESKRLLYFSTLSVKEIAYRLGFEDASYFVRFFRRMTGIPPLQLRQQQAGSKSTIDEADNAMT
ncbi:AraC family transcriptional regulator [Pontibacter chinhatensis]|uniref:Transcriptional regulator, AraC family n=1 Tax=Pontibacter chinhatensis TaxID=1436961 RepID=A0A1I2MFR5_9BACT|nr:helix-turn-helix domain-containing protein [Pontibacter chinhatensis]SFF88206.1 transcriptional regulator, AraC family [Pontibacter chinhatensis]